MSTTRYEENHSSAIIRCAIYAFQNHGGARHYNLGEHFKLLKDGLSLALKGLAQIQKAGSPDWCVDTDNPGFLLKQSGFVFVRIPAHLIQLFPDRGALDNIWKLGAQIKTSENSILHICGSNAVKEVFNFVNDIDFCEYTADKPSEIARSIKDIVSGSNCPGYCTKVKISDNEFLCPFDLDGIESEASDLNYQNADRCSFKIDYLLDFDWFKRPFEVTNLGIVCKDNNGNFESDGFGKTFAYQQAQITGTDIVPTRLDDPEEAGRYALHLLHEVNKYKRSHDVLKMLKRLLSLVRFFYFKDLTEKFHKLFENSTILVKSELKEIDRLLQQVPALESCVNPHLDTAVADKLNNYRTELTLQLEVAKLREQKYFPGGVSIEIAALLKLTSETLQRESGGVLKL